MVVIAAVDQSERGKRAVEEAIEIAEAFDDVVHVVNVLSQSEFVDLEKTEVERSGRAVNLDRVRKFAANRAEDAASGIDTNVTVEYIGLVGDAADSILDYAADHDARYVVVGPRKQSPTGKALFGSVSQDVLLNADCPVVVTMTKS